MVKNVPLVKQNVMKLEVFILGRQRIDQKRKKGWGRGRRERIEIERKETKGTDLRISRETSTLASACCSASSRHRVSD